MPANCLANGNKSGFKILTSSKLVTNASYKLMGRVGRVEKNTVLTGTGYKLYVK